MMNLLSMASNQACRMTIPSCSRSPWTKSCHHRTEIIYNSTLIRSSSNPLYKGAARINALCVIDAWCGDGCRGHHHHRHHDATSEVGQHMQINRRDATPSRSTRRSWNKPPQASGDDSWCLPHTPHLPALPSLSSISSDRKRQPRFPPLTPYYCSS